jgi:prolipoprotein diacylglyceryl transferase
MKVALSVFRRQGGEAMHVDPLIHELGGVKIWWYGLAYALGFLAVHLWILLRRDRLGLSREEVVELSLLLAAGALVCGRTFDVVVYEWGYYRIHPWQLACFWYGGFATHGILIGGILGGITFCRLRGTSFASLADEIVIPGAFMLALGRIGNHINGEIYGSLSEAGWAMQFPYASGLRHPVALYEAGKNVIVALILLVLLRYGRRIPGLLFAHFVLWYGLLRLAADHFRDYESYWFGIGRGQYFNLAMALIGVCGVLLISEAARLVGLRQLEPARHPPRSDAWPWLKATAFYGIVALCLAIPSGWTRQVLETMRVIP